MRNSILTLALITTALTSCAVGPDFEEPQTQTAPNWSVSNNKYIEAPSGAATTDALKVKVEGLKDLEKTTSNINKQQPKKAEEPKAEETKEKQLEEEAKKPADPLKEKTEAKVESEEKAKTEEPVKAPETTEVVIEEETILTTEKPKEAEAKVAEVKKPEAEIKTAEAKPLEVYTNPNWWENFNDDTLNSLISMAEAENKDLKIAAARVKEARANRLSSGAILLPQVNAGIEGARSNQPSVFNSKPINTYQYGFDASWEIDIFGGNRRRYEAQDEIVQATKADEKDVLISVRAEVARNYVEVRNFQNQIRITEDNIKSQEESFNLTKSQRDAGLVSDLDVSQSESLFFATKSRLPSLKTQAEGAKNNLAILLGKQPGQLDSLLDKEGQVPVSGKQYVIDTPASVLANRPDIKSAERNLAAATALQGAAIAELFPKISLTGFFGYTDSTLIKGANFWSLGGNAIMNLLDFGKIRGQIRAADAQQEQYLNIYERTVLEALAEVQTNLVAYINEEQRRASLVNAVDSNIKAVDLSKQRYDSGISAFTDVLLAQRELYEVQSQLAESEAAVARSLIALNKSLGR